MSDYDEMRFELSGVEIRFLTICAAPWDRIIRLRASSCIPIADRLGEIIQFELGMSRTEVEAMGRRLFAFGLIRHPEVLYRDHLSLMPGICEFQLTIDCITWLGCAVLGAPAHKRLRYGGPR